MSSRSKAWLVAATIGVGMAIGTTRPAVARPAAVSISGVSLRTKDEEKLPIKKIRFGGDLSQQMEENVQNCLHSRHFSPFSSVRRTPNVSETRLQERSLTEQIDEIRSLHELLAAEFKSRADSLDSRFDRLEALMFNTSSQLQAPGKAPMDPSPSNPPTPTPYTPNRPPDPPDLTDRYNNGRAHYNTLTSRLAKIRFSSFDGTQLRDWISKCEEFFDIDGTPPVLKVRLAALHLTGKANQWHRNYMSTRYGIFPPWTEYVVAISGRFSELYDDPLAELVALKQGSDSVTEYLDKFETARMRTV
ncbi:hypothetical protein F2Q70_00043392 [Brassica cretica]|uniref:Retrotransposon gag domain-containing protein n=1 Tax=Brassica cretica TaxID=69181 RepID=A0A8S9KMT1_BRACR|nr:hypothetical protein F2Q70_00043392 [Brassica cretica]